MAIEVLPYNMVMFNNIELVCRYLQMYGCKLSGGNYFWDSNVYFYPMKTIEG